MTSKTGGYVTRRLHVPQEVWSQGGAKLTNIPEKIRVVEVLCSALEELAHWSAEYFGAGNVSSGMALGIGAIGRKEGEQWAAKLEEFSSVCDGVVGQFGKKLGVGEGFVTKKSSGVSTSPVLVLSFSRTLSLSREVWPLTYVRVPIYRSLHGEAASPDRSTKSRTERSTCFALGLIAACRLTDIRSRRQLGLARAVRPGYIEALPDVTGP